MWLTETELSRTYLFSNLEHPLCFYDVDYFENKKTYHKIHHRYGWSWIYLDNLVCVSAQVKTLTVSNPNANN